MPSKLRAWASSVPSRSKASMWSELKEAGVSEARFARDDVRQKLIEEGWSGSVQTPRGIKTYTTEPETTAETEDLDIHGNRIEGEDFSGTVWDQENDNGIETMQQVPPSPPEPEAAPDIEPD